MTLPRLAGDCTPPPPQPPDGSSDWADAVHGNCFSNIARLALWKGGTQILKHGQSPQQYFAPLAPQELPMSAQKAAHVYVVVHGWARGYRAAVQAAGGKLRWWEDGASVGGLWPSDWAWVGVSGVSPALSVNATGLLQSIVAYDAAAIPLAYSWIDDSATDGGTTQLDDVYTSEAYTTINGIRLASALLQVLGISFWHDPDSRLHLIGHSHGSKVATVAALYLQARSLRVDGLTLLDAPESKVPRDANGANFLPLFLSQMAIADPGLPGSPGAFVDNYASYFGVAYEGAANLANVVEVMLDPSKLYSFDDPGDQHSYAAGWYGGAAAGAQQNDLLPLGLAWPPPWSPYTPALDQTWPAGTTQASQWQLQAGAPIKDRFSYAFPALGIKTTRVQGNVTGDPLSGLVFCAPDAPQTCSEFVGGYANSPLSDGYGLAFDVKWSSPREGDYLVVTAESPEERRQEVLLVMDGKSAPLGLCPVSLNADISSYLEDLAFYIFYFPAAGNSRGTVTVSNFRSVTVTSS